MALRDLGFSADAERLYRALLVAESFDLSGLAAATGMGEEQLRATLDTLADLGVVRIDADGLSVPDPQLVLGTMIERVEDELMARYRRVSATRSEVVSLRPARAAGPAVGRDPDVERIEGLDAVRERIAELSFFARASVLAIQPGGPQSAAALEASRPLDLRAARRRMKIRLIHEASVLQDELNRSYLRELVMLGADVRVSDRCAERMIILDERVAIVPIEPGNSRRGALVVRHPGLLVGLLDLFHRAWEASQELPWARPEHDPAGDPAAVSDQDRNLITMLASGCTDETAAREIGVSVRHLRRRISRLMADLGAKSRFEAGAEAARRGWL